jgi:hypothetical protein
MNKEEFRRVVCEELFMTRAGYITNKFADHVDQTPYVDALYDRIFSGVSSNEDGWTPWIEATEDPFPAITRIAIEAEIETSTRFERISYPCFNYSIYAGVLRYRLKLEK